MGDVEGTWEMWGGGLVKVNDFHLTSTIITMMWEVAVYIVTDIFDGWC